MAKIKWMDGNGFQISKKKNIPDHTRQFVLILNSDAKNKKTYFWRFANRHRSHPSILCWPFWSFMTNGFVNFF
jgi:hypothetical protein